MSRSSARRPSALSMQILLCVLIIARIGVCRLEAYNVKLESAETWRKLAKDDIASAKKYVIEKDTVAKNVLFFLGDGMGISTITAARIYKGQLEGNPGEEGWLTFDRFMHHALVKTYNTNYQVADSAATATAYLCGVKANSRTVGVDQSVLARNCSSYSSSADVFSIAHYANLTGKSIGLVTTTGLTHATPASLYAHSPFRKWEDDTARNADVTNENLRSQCPDIALQMITNAKDYRVLLGGGYSRFLPRNQADYFGKNGTRSDGRDLINEWKKYQRERKRKAKFVRNKFELLESAVHSDYLFGIFASKHMEFDESRIKTAQPSLSEMTEAAIQVLSRNPKGFLLLVEGGRIDHAHHMNKARAALSETVAFDKAVSKAISMTNVKETLTIVTADHSHVFTIGSYPSRGRSILEKTDFQAGEKLGRGMANDNLPHTSLGYYNGPSAENEKSRIDISLVDTTSQKFRQPSLVPLNSETHGGEDVAVYAQGPGAWLFHRSHEQSYVAHVVMYASCVGDYSQQRHCLNSSVMEQASLLLTFTLALMLHKMRLL